MKLEEIRTPVSSIAGVGPALSAALASLSLYTVGELFAHYPRAFDDRTRRIPLAQFAQHPKVHTVAQVFAHRWFGFGRTRTLKIMITDGSADAELAAFNRPFLEKTLPVGSIISVTGAFSERYGTLQSASFEAELVSRDGSLADFAAGDVPGSAVLPVYPLAAGLTQVQLRKIMRRALQGYGRGIDSDVPPECFAKRGFMPKQQALHALHNPKTLEEAEHARASLIYEELFCFQRGVARRALEHKGALPSLADCARSPEDYFADGASTDLACSGSGAAETFAGTLSPRQKQLFERLPFSLTRDQMTVIAEINADIDRGYRSRAAAAEAGEAAAEQGTTKESSPSAKAGESETKLPSPVPPPAKTVRLDKRKTKLLADSLFEQSGRINKLEPEKSAAESTEIQRREAPEFAAVQSRIDEWLLPENLAQAKGKNGEAIFALFGKELKPIAHIAPEYLALIETEIVDAYIYSSKSYFIDHALNHHPELALAEYAKIQEIISRPDEVRLHKKRNALIFFKRYENHGTVMVGFGAKASDKLYYTTFFNQTGKKKSRYQALRLIPTLESSLVVDQPTIRHAGKPASAGDLSALNDGSHNIAQSVRRVNNEAPPIPPVYTMARLLQGDVGAGQTLAAFFACVRVADWGGQSAFLAPTELLARQHAETAAELLSPLGIRVAYLTGSVPPEGRARLLRALDGGAIDVAIGTHALFLRGVAYRDLQLAVIDEQHRFGVLQRNAIIEKGRKPFAPHLLMMSATPIPRTLALTAFGDLDISVIRSLPQGRLPVKTYLARMGNEQKVYDFVRRELEAGHQAYFVYPRIEDADSSGTGGTATSALKNAEDMYRYLSGTEYPQFAAALIHSKVDEDAQHRILRDFRAGAIRVLVATSVVEVGVDNPNATCMVVEHADRFGLAALHQIRGRVGRGSAQSYCFLVYGKTLSEAGARRMKALRETADGFRIAEEDLRLRGPGEISGIQQSGYLTLGIADLARDTELLEMAREDAFREAERSSSPHARGVLTEFASQTRLA